ncbi:DUF6442 family protein [uncultured Ruminococcus sp.]|uniref:DUF6442 family protein n=1 Tax=uncultured Ruminococcus sp. TaxID=165186 RepID=UPI002620B377|nr:DUF6442 family protein [uncultured Ruminococcus sp.]
MNKEEILAKSRQENKNRDIAEIDKSKNASRFALIFSMCFIVLLTTLSFIATGHVDYGVIATEFSITFSMYLYRAIKSRSAADIFCAAAMGFTFAVSTFMAVCELFNIKP